LETSKKQDKNMNNTKRLWMVLVAVLGLGLAAVITKTALAQVPPPVLTISPLGSNQFSVLITNGVSTTNYTLLWTPALGDSLYPWLVLGAGGVGETNFTVDAGEWPVGFFQVLVGGDSDGDGVPEWIDGQPFNPNVGALSVTIDYPTNGMTLN
jgi:hypothetical protein